MVTLLLREAADPLLAKGLTRERCETFPPIGRRVGAALVAALTLLTATSIATPATAATTATISGRVSAADTGASIPLRW